MVRTLLNWPGSQRKSAKSRRKSSPRRRRNNLNRGADLGIEALEPRWVLASPGALDLAFGAGGMVIDTIQPRPIETLNAVVVQNDGMIVVVGTVNGIGGGFRELVLARYNRDGSPDMSFGTHGGYTLYQPSSTTEYTGHDLVIDHLDRFIVVGRGTDGGVQGWAVTRFTATGSLDTTFGRVVNQATDDRSGTTIIRFPGPSNTMLSGDVRGVAVQEDGKIVVVGSVSWPQIINRTDWGIARLNDDGSFDTTFGAIDPNTGQRIGRAMLDFAGRHDRAWGLVIQPDSRIVVTGTASPQGRSDVMAVARWMPNGELDTTFGTVVDETSGERSGRYVVTNLIPTHATSQDFARSVALDGDKIVIGGNSTVNSSGWRDMIIMRFNSDGLPDATFNQSPALPVAPGALRIDFQTFIEFGQSILVQPDGNYLISGYANTGSTTTGNNLRIASARVLPSGVLDPAFGNGGKVETLFVPDFLPSITFMVAMDSAMQPDGKLLVAGHVYTSENRHQFIARYETGLNLQFYAISGNAEVDEGSPYTLNLFSSDPTTSQWTINWGDTIEVVQGNPSSVTHVYADGDAQHTITATVTTSSGEFVVGNTVPVTVHNVAPTLTLSGPMDVDDGAVYTLNLSSFDPGDDTITHWTINWGDGNIETVPGNPTSVNHIYTSGPAVHRITATATDEDGTWAAGNTLWVFVHKAVETVPNTHPVLSVVSDQAVEAGTALNLPNLGTFTDLVQPAPSTGRVGLNPMDFASLGSFNPLMNVVIDTDTLTISGIPSPGADPVDLGFATGAVVSADIGYGAYEIAVFTFSDFHLAADLTVTASGSRPLALLSQGDMTVAGVIDVSARQAVGSLTAAGLPGPGGGSGGVSPSNHGQPAAGAPLESRGTLGPGGPLGGASGSGGGSRGVGGPGGVAGAPSGNGAAGSLPGGHAFANLASAIHGGSGGSSAGRPSAAGLAAGGSGGGGIELGAANTLWMFGEVLANGGHGSTGDTFTLPGTGGGGGAAGGILLHGNHVVQTGLLSARGGDGGSGLQNGGGGGGGEIMIVHGVAGAAFDGGIQDVSGGALAHSGPGPSPGSPGNVTFRSQPTVGSVPAIEVFTFEINWGDGSPLDTGLATIDLPGAAIGDVVHGSFGGSHTYAAPGLYTVTVTIHDGRGGSDSQTFDVTVTSAAPEAHDAAFELVENSPNGTVVGIVSATGAEPLTFSIIGGNGAAAFAIDSDTGQITVSDSSLLDYDDVGLRVQTLEVQVSNSGGSDTALVTISLLNQPSVHGVVFLDVNQNGLFDANEPGIGGVAIRLLDEFGQPVLDAHGEAIVAITSGGGYFLFEDLDPGTYQLFKEQLTGVDPGAAYLGDLGGIVLGHDRVQLALERTDAWDYAFSELGQQLTVGDAAGTGFWQNRHGQALIAAGGTQLASWLTDNFPNIFGNTFVGGTGDDVALFFRDQLFKQQGKKSPGPPKVDAQFMAVALATFFTSRALAGEVAAAYGLNVTDTGIGTRVVNVGTYGAAFGVDDGTDLTIMQLLLATNALTNQSGSQSGFTLIYDGDGDGTIDAYEAMLRTLANALYAMINDSGGI